MFTPRNSEVKKLQANPWKKNLGVLILLSLAFQGSAQAAGEIASVSVANPERTPSLKQVFESAWFRQPESQSMSARQSAAKYGRKAAASWTAEPVSLEMSIKTDQANRNIGSREYEIGFAIPLWLWNERSHSIALADAQSRQVYTRTAAAKLRIAASTREAYWSWAQSRIEVTLSQARLINAKKLALDVSRRVRAGELSRADQYQADGDVAAAESELAQTENLHVSMEKQLVALTGMSFSSLESNQVQPNKHASLSEFSVEPIPALPASFSELDPAHPLIADLVAQSEVAMRTVSLAREQTRPNPQLRLLTTQERGGFDERMNKTATIGISIPFGYGARNSAKVASANADAIELESQLRLEKDRILAELSLS